MKLYQLSDNNLNFPSIDHALSEPNGLLAVGGDLQPQRILNAYQQGIFPWFSEHDPLMWWSPNPRAIIKLCDLRINRTLRKALRRSPFKITLNTAFEAVIAQCADAPFRDDGIWILPEMQVAYKQLHKLGHAHSIEIWQTNNIHETDETYDLVGGLYGIAVNGFFSGESMFYSKPNASKFAVVALQQLLGSVDIEFIDCQLLNPFLADMGAIEISRDDFKIIKKKAINTNMPSNFWHARELYLTI